MTDWDDACHRCGQMRCGCAHCRTTVMAADASWVELLMRRAHLPEGASAFVLRQHGIDIRFSLELPPR